MGLIIKRLWVFRTPQYKRPFLMILHQKRAFSIIARIGLSYVKTVYTFASYFSIILKKVK
jgi:hypothetical protein